MIQLQYTLTAAEVQEAFRPIQSTGKPIRWGFVVASWTYLIGALLFMIYLTADQRSAHSSENFWLTLSPPLASMLIITVRTMLHAWTSRRNMRPDVLAGHAFGRLGSHLLTLALIAPFAFLAVAVIPALAIPWHPSPALQLLVGMLPFCAFFIGSLIVAWVRSPSRGTRELALWPWLNRPATLGFSDDGVRLKDGVTDASYAWPFFIRFRETTNLILLHNEQNQQTIIPKRALSSEADVTNLYALIQSHIAHGQFLPRESRFPVLLSQEQTATSESET